MESEVNKSETLEAIGEKKRESEPAVKWYNNRAKVIFSLQAFPPLGIYALLRSSVFTPVQKVLVAAGVSAVIAIIVSVKRYFFF